MPEITFPSFAGGAVGPSFYSRTDQDSYFVSAITLHNTIATQTGPALGRGGTRFIAATKDNGKALILPFHFNEEQAYVAEFGDGYVRVLKDHGQVLESSIAITGISKADPAVVTASHTLTDGRTVYISGVGGMVEVTDGFYRVEHVLGSSVNITDLDRSSPVKITFGGGHGFVGGEDVFLESAGGMIEVNDRTFRLDPVASQVLAITGITRANPAVVTVSGVHGLADGDTVVIESAGGMTEVNDARYTVSPHFGAAATVTAITKASPGVVTTSANHGFDYGNSVLLESVSGMTEVNDIEFTAGRSLQANKSINYISGSGTGVVSLQVPSHGYSTGDFVYISAIGYATQLLGLQFTVTVSSADYFSLDGTDFSTISHGPLIFFSLYIESGTVNRVDKNKFTLVDTDTSAYTTYTSGGTAKENQPDQFELDSTDSSAFTAYTSGGTATEVAVNDFYLSGVNGLRYTAWTSGGTVKPVSRTSFKLHDLDEANVDSSAFTTYTSGGTVEAIHEIASPYAADDLFDADGLPKIQIEQSSDFLFLAHPDYPPMQLTRSGHSDWGLSEFINEEGPFLDENEGATEIYATASAGTGAGAVVTLTASAPLWTSDHIGAMWQLRLADGATAVIWTTGTAYTLGQEILSGDLFYRCTDEGTSGSEAPTHDIGEAYDGAASGTNCKWLYIHNGRGIVIVTGYTSSTQVTATIITDLPAGVVGSTNATGRWSEGAWSEAQGYPRAVAIHEGRLVWGGTAQEPLALDFSNADSLFYYNPVELDGTVIRSTAFRRALDSNNPIRWMKSTEKGLVIGTLAGEWIVATEGVTQGFGADTAVARAFSENGAAPIRPIRNGDSLVYVHRARKRLRDITFSIDQQKLVTSDRNFRADHIAQAGMVALCYAEEPHRIIWSVLGNGEFIGLTYNREPAAQVSAFHSHALAGAFGAGSPVIESSCVIPSPDASVDDLYFVVKRTIGGATVRYLEWLTQPLELGADIEDGVYMDSAVSYDVPIAISAITQAAPAVLTTATHGFTNGDEIRIVGVSGMTEINGVYAYCIDKTSTTLSLASETVVASITGITKANPAVVTVAAAHGLSDGDVIAILSVGGMTEVNGLSFTVANSTATTFELSGVNSSSFTTYTAGGSVHATVDSTSYSAYISGGEAAKTVTSLSGLDHLALESVAILADGVYSTGTVSALGALTIDAAAVVHVGLYDNRVLETVYLESRPGDQINTKKKSKRVSEVEIEVVESAKCWVGTAADTATETNMDQMIFDEFYSEDGAPRRITGTVEETVSDSFARRKLIRLEQREPYPFHVTAITATFEVGDG